MRNFFTRSLLVLTNRLRWTRQRDRAYFQRMGRLGAEGRHTRRLRCGDRVFPLPKLERDRARVPRPGR